MKKISLLAIAISILLNSSIIHAQNQTQARINMAIATLQQYADRIPGMLQKVVDCSLGRTTCTQAEITKTRVILSTVGAALTVLAIAIGGVIAKQKGAWPFKPAIVPEPSPAPTQPQEEQKPTATVVSESPIPSPVVSPPTGYPKLTLVPMTDDEDELARKALANLIDLSIIANDQKELSRQKDIIFQSFNTIKKLIEENKLNPQDRSGALQTHEQKLKGTLISISIGQLLKLANDLYNFEK
jgi:hypothetical protein